MMAGRMVFTPVCHPWGKYMLINGGAGTPGGGLIQRTRRRPRSPSVKMPVDGCDGSERATARKQPVHGLLHREPFPQKDGRGTRAQGVRQVAGRGRRTAAVTGSPSNGISRWPGLRRTTTSAVASAPMADRRARVVASAVGTIQVSCTMVMDGRSSSCVSAASDQTVSACNSRRLTSVSM